jgi:hypothetical protein
MVITAVATVSATVTIPAGATTATFPVTTRLVTAWTTVPNIASVESELGQITITIQLTVTS